MDIFKLSIYERLRDFNVPAAVLDDIFAKSDDADLLINSWQELESAGMSGDDIASKVADMILEDIDIDSQNLDEK